MLQTLALSKQRLGVERVAERLAVSVQTARLEAYPSGIFLSADPFRKRAGILAIGQKQRLLPHWQHDAIAASA